MCVGPQVPAGLGEQKEQQYEREGGGGFCEGSRGLREEVVGSTDLGRGRGKSHTHNRRQRVEGGWPGIVLSRDV